MSEKLRRRLPYKDTKVGWHKTKGQIDQLLNDYGVTGVQWTTYKGEESLKFIVEAEVKGVKREIGIEVSPPLIFVKRRTPRRGLVQTRNRNQEYRLLYWWLKSKLESVIFGLSTIEKEFLAQVMVALPDGSTTVGTIMEDYIAHDKLTALPAPEKEERRVVEAES